MNCQEFWETMPDEGAAHPHAAECPSCATRIAQQRELCAGLLAMAAQMDHIQAPERVEARLLDAFRAQTGQRPPIARPRLVPVLSWAAMAAMIAAGIWIVHERQPEMTRFDKRHSVELALADATNVEEPSDDGFVPLPGAAQLAPSEDLDLVRVELPRSAMMQIGIEVSPERAAEPVQADVMVGPDGLARSVRFLETTGSD